MNIFTHRMMILAPVSPFIQAEPGETALTCEVRNKYPTERFKARLRYAPDDPRQQDPQPSNLIPDPNLVPYYIEADETFINMLDADSEFPTIAPPEPIPTPEAL